jgi:hypothetical protein
MRSAFTNGAGANNNAAPANEDDSLDPTPVAAATSQRRNGKRP